MLHFCTYRVCSPAVSLHPSPMQVGSVEVPVSAEGLFPAVGMHSMGEEVKVDLQAEWFLEEDDSMMMVDSHEDDWGRLYDVRVSGTVRSRKICYCFPSWFRNTPTFPGTFHVCAFRAGITVRAALTTKQLHHHTHFSMARCSSR